MIRATRKVLLRKELKRITLNLCFILIITFSYLQSVKKVTHFNDIKLQQFQVIHSLFPASPLFKKK